MSAEPRAAAQRVLAHADSMQCVFRAFDVSDAHAVETLNTLKSVSRGWRHGVRSVLRDWRRAAGSWAVWDVVHSHHLAHGMRLPAACTLHPGRAYGALSNGPGGRGAVPGHPSCSMRGVLRDMRIEYPEGLFNGRDDELDEGIALTRFVFECEGVTYDSVGSAMSRGFPRHAAQTRRQEIESISIGAEVHGYWLDFAWREELLEHEAVSGDSVLHRQDGSEIVTVLD